MINICILIYICIQQLKLQDVICNINYLLLEYTNIIQFPFKPLIQLKSEVNTRNVLLMKRILQIFTVRAVVCNRHPQKMSLKTLIGLLGQSWMNVERFEVFPNNLPPNFSAICRGEGLQISLSSNFVEQLKRISFEYFYLYNFSFWVSIFLFFSITFISFNRIFWNLPFMTHSIYWKHIYVTQIHISITADFKVWISSWIYRLPRSMILLQIFILKSCSTSCRTIYELGYPL